MLKLLLNYTVHRFGMFFSRVNMNISAFSVHFLCLLGLNFNVFGELWLLDFKVSF